MMIKFSWEKINNKLGWTPSDVLLYFYLKRDIKPPCYLGPITNKIKIAAQEPYPKGACYITNINAALTNIKSPNDLYIYLELASKRSLFDYKIRGNKHLPLPLVPEYLMGLVETNPALEVKNGNVYFKFEQERQNGY